MKRTILAIFLGAAFFSAMPQTACAVGGIEGYWLKTGPANGAPAFLSITNNTMQIDRGRPVKISAVQSGSEVIVRTRNVKNPGYGLSDNNFDAMNVVDDNTMLVTRPSPQAGQPARQTIYRRIGYEEAKKYLPRRARKR